MKRSEYFKFLAVLYVFVSVVFYKNISTVYGFTFYPADAWYNIAFFGICFIALFFLLLNVFLLDVRFGEASGNPKGSDGSDGEPTRKNLRIGEYREAGSKYSFLWILPMLVMAVMNIQYNYILEGLSTLNIFFAAMLYQGAVNRGADELVLDQAKAGTAKEKPEK